VSEKYPNPNDWNRGYTVGSGRSPFMFWLGIVFVIVVIGGAAWSRFAG